MSTTYKILVFDKPINEASYTRLTKLGALVPFDPQSLKFNVYAYVDLSDEDLIEEIREHFICRDYNMIASADEVQKHMDKIKVTFKHEEGDVVLYKEKYKKLPFVVKEVDETTLTLACKLRTFTFEIKVQPNMITSVDENESYLYNLPFLSKSEDLLIVDFDSYFPLDLTSEDKYFLDLFRMILKLKTLYKGKRVIFLNPDNLATFVGASIGVPLLYGDLNNFIVEEVIKPTEVYLLTTESTKLARVDYIIDPRNPFTVINAKDYETKHGYTSAQIEQYSRYCSKYKDIPTLDLFLTKLDYSTDDIFVKRLFEVDNIKLGEYSYEPTFLDLDIGRLKAYLKEVGGEYYIYNIEKYLRILHS